MDQIKIGKFIAELRKERKMTQKELADKLSVTDRAVSKWENGRGMPDVSLLRKISEVFEITTNELLSAEKIDDKDKDRKIEENYFCAVDSKVKLQSDVTGYLVFKIIGYLLLFVGLGYFATEGLWINIVTLVGSLFVIVGSYKLVRSWKLVPRIIFVLIVCIMIFAVVNYFDYQRVSSGNISKPHFYYKKVTKENCVLYKKLTFSCIVLNNEKMNGGTTCYVFESNDKGTHSIFMEEYEKVEDALESKYCKKDYDPYEDGLYRKLEE